MTGEAIGAVRGDRLPPGRVPPACAAGADIDTRGRRSRISARLRSSGRVVRFARGATKEMLPDDDE